MTDSDTRPAIIEFVERVNRGVGKLTGAGTLERAPVPRREPSRRRLRGESETLSELSPSKSTVRAVVSSTSCVRSHASIAARNERSSWRAAATST